MTEDEAALMQRAQQGDVDAFMKIIDVEDASLRALTFRLLGDRISMDDAMQETYVKAFKSIGRFDSRSSLGTWLYRIAYNVCMEELRRRSRTEAVSIESIAVNDPTPDPSVTAVRRVDLQVALGNLPPDQRAAVVLVDALGLDYATAAEILEVPSGTIGSRLYHARTVLRRALQSGEKARPQE